MNIDGQNSNSLTASLASMSNTTSTRSFKKNGCKFKLKRNKMNDNCNDVDKTKYFWNMCITGDYIWSRNSHIDQSNVRKLQVAQRIMEESMLVVTLRESVRRIWGAQLDSKTSKVKLTRMKSSRARHMAKTNDGKQITPWRDAIK